MFNYANYRFFSAVYDEKTRTFSLLHEKYGVIAENIRVEADVRDLNYVPRHISAADFGKVTLGFEKHIDEKALRAVFSDGPEELPGMTLTLHLSAKGVKIRFEAQRDEYYRYTLLGSTAFGKSPETDTLAVVSSPVKGVLNVTSGPAASPAADALFDRRTDTLLSFGMPMNFSFDYASGSYGFAASFDGAERGDTVNIVPTENYLSDRFGIRYKCIRPKFGGVVPAGFMTWYALTWDANEKTLTDNIKAQAEKLKKYGANIIWVDWEWYHNPVNTGDGIKCDSFTPDPDKYPHGMKYICDFIKENGFIPAIWISPDHDVRENEYLKKYPEMLLIKRKSWCGDYFFDPTNDKYLNEFLPAVFNNILDWGYRAVKWDSLPRALDYYDEYHDRFANPSLSSEQAMRNSVEVGRKTLGDDVYMLSCHGEGSRDIEMYSDIFDAARVGADVFDWHNFLEFGVKRLLKYYPLHNTAMYCDPDNLVLREAFNTREQAISRVSIYSLLGTPLNFGDDLTKLSEERLNILSRALPGFQVRPAELSEKQPDSDVMVINDRIRTRFEEYNVIDVFNTTPRAVEYTLDLAELGLDRNSFFCAFDFWNERYMGAVTREIKLHLGANESKVIALRRAEKRPQLLSVSRHIAQGATEIEALEWNKETKTLSGRVQTVGGEECRIYVTVPDGWQPENESVTIENGAAAIRVMTAENTSAEWSVKFR